LIFDKDKKREEAFTKENLIKLYKLGKEDIEIYNIFDITFKEFHVEVLIACEENEEIVETYTEAEFVQM